MLPVLADELGEDLDGLLPLVLGVETFAEIIEGVAALVPLLVFGQKGPERLCGGLVELRFPPFSHLVVGRADVELRGRDRVGLRVPLHDRFEASECRFQIPLLVLTHP